MSTPYNQETRRKAREAYDKKSTTKAYNVRFQKADMLKFDIICKERGMARHELFAELMSD